MIVSMIEHMHCTVLKTHTCGKVPYKAVLLVSCWVTPISVVLEVTILEFEMVF